MKLKFCFRVFFFLFLILQHDDILSQDKKIDSLLNRLMISAGNSKLKPYYELAEVYSKTNLNISSKYACETIRRALDLNEPHYIIGGLNRLARNYYLQSNYEFSEKLLKQSLAWAIKTNNKVQESSINGYIGYNYMSLGNSKQALYYYYTSLKIAKAINNDSCLGLVYNNIGLSYLKNNELDSSINYFKKALVINQKLNRIYSQKVNLNNIGGILYAQQNYKDAINYFKHVYRLDSVSGDSISMIETLSNIGGTNISTGNFNEAKKDITKAMNLAYNKNMMESYIDCKANLSEIELNNTSCETALLLTNEALELAIQSKYNNILPTLYNNLQTIYEKKGDFFQSLHYSKLYHHLNDSLINEQNISYIESLKQQEEIEIKNNQLAITQNELALKSALGKSQQRVIVTLVLLLLMVVFLVYFIIQRMQSHKKALLQKQSLLSFINGQEEERKRISADMHDGICQQLAVIKMGLDRGANNSESNEILKTSQELEKVIDEVRKISHNMMPATLTELGLTEALESLVFKLNETTSISINLLIDKSIFGVEQSTAIHLYRIVQELLSNMVKHAKASYVNLKLEVSVNTLVLLYEDNGVGINSVKQSDGIGLKNIQTRVELLNGKLHRDTHSNILKITVPLR